MGGGKNASTRPNVVVAWFSVYAFFLLISNNFFYFIEFMCRCNFNLEILNTTNAVIVSEQEYFVRLLLHMEIRMRIVSP